MKLALKNLFDREDESLSYAEELDFSDVGLWGIKPFILPVRIAGRVVNRASIVTCRYTADFEYCAQCGRCLKEETRSMHLAFSHVLVQRLDDVDTGELILVEDSILDTQPLALADILLEMPSTVLCREDCKGLCPKCGADLNLGDCGCSRKEPDPRLAILSQFFDDSSQT